MKLCLNAFFLLIFCAASVQAQMSRVQGSGKVVRKDIPVGGFTKLRNQSSANLYLVDAGKTSVATIEADDNIIPLIEIITEGDVLIVKNKDKVSFNTKNNINVYLPVKTLTELQNNGSGNLRTEKTLEAPAFKFTDNGSGNSTVSLKTKDLQLSGNGSGNVTLSGQAESFTLTLRGSGNLNAGKFSVETAQVKLSGSGNVQIKCTNALNVQLTGSGNVTYAGSPSLTKSITGSGEVRQMD
jgi:hypothetical protein